MNLANPFGAAEFHRFLSWRGWRWITLACVLGLVISAVAIRHSDHAAYIRTGLFPAKSSEEPAEVLPTIPAEAKMVDGKWMQLHEAYLQEKNVYMKQGVDLVVYGDSITESFRGTQVGVKITKFLGIPEVFQQHFGHIRTAAFSIAGDTTRNLLWRLQNGEGPAGLSPKVAMLLIGTNDISHPVYALDIKDPLGASAIVAAAIFAAVDILLKEAARMHVILLAVMPRGEKMLFVPMAEKYKQPSLYSPVIAAINSRLKHFAERHDRVSYVDCNHVFLDDEEVKGGLQLRKELMPDTVHPNALGMDAFLTCLGPHLKPYLPAGHG